MTVSPIHPIELESYRILEGRVDLSGWSPGPRAVVARVIHATADPDFAATMVVDEAAVAAGIEAIGAGAPVVTDVEMTRAALSSAAAECFLDEIGVEAPEDLTRSAAAMRLGAFRHPRGAVFVIGCAPTALAELVRLAAASVVQPALVVGLPVGFVGAADAKEALRASGLVSISNRGEKGGSAAAGAAFNALRRLAHG